MKKRAYVPDAGDIVWLQFNPQAGNEQAGHRSALVISSRIYNEKSGLMVCCPITTKIKGYPFEVVTQIAGIDCAILADQIKSLDWRARQSKRKATAAPDTMQHVKGKMRALLGIK